MKFFIPELGLKIKLKKPFSFKLYFEHRNYCLFDPKIIEEERLLGLEISSKRDAEIQKLQEKFEFDFGVGLWHLNEETKEKYFILEKEIHKKYNKEYRAFFDALHKPYTFAKGTILIVDRIYIRKGAENYSSLSFKVPSMKRGRFWAKLEDVHNMEFDIVETN